MPGLLTKNLKIIDAIFDIYPFFLAVFMAYLASITFKTLHLARTQKIFFWSMVLSGLIVSLPPLFDWQSALVYNTGRFIFWEDTKDSIYNIFIGILMTLPSLWFVIFFLRRGFISSDKIVRIRTFLMAGGMSSLILL